MAIGAATWTDLRDQIAAVLDSVAGLKVYDHDPMRDLDELPALTMGLPTVERVPAREVEETMAHKTVTVTWPCQLVVVKGGGARDTAARALQMVGAIGGALDQYPGLTLLTGSTPANRPTAKLLRAAPSDDDRPDNEHPTFRYDLEIEVALSPSN